MALQIRRGTNADRQLITPLQGELIFTTDTKKLYIGDGITSGGIAVDTTNGGGGVTELSGLSDVSLSTLTAGQVLKFNGNNWVNDTDATGGSSISSLDDIPGVVLTTPSNGQVLKFDGTNWVNDTDATGGGGGATNLDGLTDVIVNSPSVGQVLKFNGTSWVNDTDTAGTTINSLDDVPGVVLSTPTNNQVLKYINGDWINSTAISSIDDIPGISSIAPTTGQVLKFDGTNWTNASNAKVSILGNDDSSFVDNNSKSINANFINLISDNTQNTPISISHFSNNNTSSNINILKYRGTNIAPVSANPGDEIFKIIGQAYDGFNNISSVSIVGSIDSDSSIGPGIVPGKLTVLVANDSGDLLPRIEVTKDNKTIVLGELYSDLFYIRSKAENPFSCVINHTNDVGNSSLFFQRARGSDLLLTTVQQNDQIGLISFRSYTGTQHVSSATISGVADPTGVITSSTVPGLLRFGTTGDDGVPRTRLSIDKNGVVITYGQHWGVTSVPTGVPLLLLANNSSVSLGTRSLMRRSRGTFEVPTSVIDNDVLFRLMWGGHDGTTYRDTASIEGVVSGPVSTGIIPTKLDIKTTNSTGSLVTAATVTTEQTIEAFGAIKFATYENPTARDARFTSGIVQAGMVVFLTDSTGSGGPPKLQVNTDGTTSGWTDLH